MKPDKHTSKPGIRISDAPSRPAAVLAFAVTVLLLWAFPLGWLLLYEAHYPTVINWPTSFWIAGYCYFSLNTSLSFCLLLLGATLKRPRILPELVTDPQCTIALVCPIYGEDTAKLDIRLHATLRGNLSPNVVFWLLSDSPEEREGLERQLIEKLRASFPDKRHAIRYRRRAANVHSKPGNFTEFMFDHGGFGYDYIAVIDSDSLLPAGVISRLVRKAEHPANRNVFLLQAKISIYNAQTRWARFAEVGTRIGNRLQFRALFLGQSSSWGHNCLIRTDVLLQMYQYSERRKTNRGVITERRPLPTGESSHDVFDFVYGSMLGFSAQYVIDVPTFEEAPATTHVNLARSQRWARGSLSAMKLVFENKASWYARFLAFNGGTSFLNCIFLFWLFLSFWIAANPEQLDIVFENNVSVGPIVGNSALLGACGFSMLTYFVFPFFATSPSVPATAIARHLLISNAVFMHELTNGVFILFKTLLPSRGWIPTDRVETSGCRRKRTGTSSCVWWMPTDRIKPSCAKHFAGVLCSLISTAAIWILLSGGPLQWWTVIAAPMLLGGLLCPLVIRFLNSSPVTSKPTRP